MRIMGIVTTGPAVKNHISPKRARELIAKLCPIRSPWFICEFLYNAHGIPCLTKADTPKIQYPKEVEVRVRSCRKTWSINRQKPKTILKMKDTKKYRAIFCMTCRTGCRSSEKFWSMKVALCVEESYPTPHIHEQMTTSNYGYDNIMLEHNAMNNIDTVAHMNVHNTQY